MCEGRVNKSKGFFVLEKQNIGFEGEGKEGTSKKRAYVQKGEK